MSLTVGILAYNSEQALPDLLASLPDGLAGVDDWHLVVVDGASTDGTVDLVRRTAPEATCVGLGGNRRLQRRSKEHTVRRRACCGKSRLRGPQARNA